MKLFLERFACFKTKTMNKFIIPLFLLLIFSIADLNANETEDYRIYHQQVIEAEKLIGLEKFADALRIYEKIFNTYEFVFLREYQIAAQLKLYLNDRQKAMEYLKQGILAGWEMKSIKKNKFLKPLLQGEEWKVLKKEYPILKKQYESKLNQNLREQVKKMYSKDQRMAIKALFKLSSKAQDRYAEKKFAPHSEKQLEEFSTILNDYGYPGEMLIGNNYWMSTILSHHNSISTAYNEQDTLYLHLQPQLMKSLKIGEVSPYELASIDDWYLTVKYDRTKPTYGILDQPSESNMPETDKLRETVYARPYELRDALEEVELKTGMNFYLSERWY